MSTIWSMVTADARATSTTRKPTASRTDRIRRGVQPARQTRVARSRAFFCNWLLSGQDTFIRMGQLLPGVYLISFTFSRTYARYPWGGAGTALASQTVESKEIVMMSTRLAFAALGIACIGAAAGGGYLATRQNAVPTPAAAMTQAPSATAAGTPVAAPVATSADRPVQETEAVVGDAANAGAKTS